MKRSLIVMFAVVAVLSVAGVALIAQDKFADDQPVKTIKTIESHPPEDNSIASEAHPQDVFDASNPETTTVAQAEIKKAFIEEAARFANVASEQELKQIRNDLYKRGATIQAQKQAAANEQAASKAVEEAETAWIQSLRNVMKQYPETVSGKRAKTLLDATARITADPFADDGIKLNSQQ